MFTFICAYKNACESGDRGKISEEVIKSLQSKPNLSYKIDTVSTAWHYLALCSRPNVWNALMQQLAEDVLCKGLCIEDERGDNVLETICDRPNREEIREVLNITVGRIESLHAEAKQKDSRQWNRRSFKVPHHNSELDNPDQDNQTFRNPAQDDRTSSAALGPNSGESHTSWAFFWDQLLLRSPLPVAPGCGVRRNTEDIVLNTTPTVINSVASFQRWIPLYARLIVSAARRGVLAVVLDVLYEHRVLKREPLELCSTLLWKTDLEYLAREKRMRSLVVLRVAQPWPPVIKKKENKEKKPASASASATGSATATGHRGLSEFPSRSGRGEFPSRSGRGELSSSASHRDNIGGVGMNTITTPPTNTATAHGRLHPLESEQEQINGGERAPSRGGGGTGWRWSTADPTVCRENSSTAALARVAMNRLSDSHDVEACFSFQNNNNNNNDDGAPNPNYRIVGSGGTILHALFSRGDSRDHIACICTCLRGALDASIPIDFTACDSEGRSVLHKVCELPLATDVARVLEAILKCRVDGGTLDWNQRVGCPSGRAEASEGNGEKGGNSRLDFLSLAAANGLLSTVWPILREQVPYFTSASAEHPLVIRSKVWAWDWNALPEEERACLERRIPDMYTEEEATTEFMRWCYSMPTLQNYTELRTRITHVGTERLLLFVTHRNEFLWHRILLHGSEECISRMLFYSNVPLDWTTRSATQIHSEDPSPMDEGRPVLHRLLCGYAQRYHYTIRAEEELLERGDPFLDHIAAVPRRQVEGSVQKRLQELMTRWKQQDSDKIINNNNNNNHHNNHNSSNNNKKRVPPETDPSARSAHDPRCGVSPDDDDEHHQRKNSREENTAEKEKCDRVVLFTLWGGDGENGQERAVCGASPSASFAAPPPHGVLIRQTLPILKEERELCLPNRPTNSTEREEVEEDMFTVAAHLGILSLVWNKDLNDYLNDVVYRWRTQRGEYRVGKNATFVIRSVVNTEDYRELNKKISEEEDSSEIGPAMPCPFFYAAGVSFSDEATRQLLDFMYGYTRWEDTISKAPSPWESHASLSIDKLVTLINDSAVNLEDLQKLLERGANPSARLQLKYVHPHGSRIGRKLDESILNFFILSRSTRAFQICMESAVRIDFHDELHTICVLPDAKQAGDMLRSAVQYVVRHKSDVRDLWESHSCKGYASDKDGKSRLDFLSLAAANGLLSTVWPILREQVPYFTSASAEHPLVIRSKVWAWDWNALPEEERACLERCIPDMHMEDQWTAKFMRLVVWESEDLLNTFKECLENGVSEHHVVEFNDPHVRGGGLPLLQYLVSESRYQALEYFLRYTPRALDFTIRDQYGYSFLHHLCFGMPDGAKVLRILLQRRPTKPLMPPLTAATTTCTGVVERRATKEDGKTPVYDRIRDRISWYQKARPLESTTDVEPPLPKEKEAGRQRDDEEHNDEEDECEDAEERRHQTSSLETEEVVIGFLDLAAHCGVFSHMMLVLKEEEVVLVNPPTLHRPSPGRSHNTAGTNSHSSSPPFPSASERSGLAGGGGGGGVGMDSAGDRHRIRVRLMEKLELSDWVRYRKMEAEETLGRTKNRYFEGFQFILVSGFRLNEKDQQETLKALHRENCQPALPFLSGVKNAAESDIYISQGNSTPGEESQLQYDAMIWKSESFIREILSCPAGAVLGDLRWCGTGKPVTPHILSTTNIVRLVRALFGRHVHLGWLFFSMCTGLTAMPFSLFPQWTNSLRGENWFQYPLERSIQCYVVPPIPTRGGGMTTSSSSVPQDICLASGRAEASEGNGEKGGNSRLDFLSLVAGNGLLSTVWPMLREQVPCFTSASAEHPLVIRSKVWAWDWNALPEEERACLERRIPEMHDEEIPCKQLDKCVGHIIEECSIRSRLITAVMCARPVWTNGVPRPPLLSRVVHTMIGEGMCSSKDIQTVLSDASIPIDLTACDSEGRSVLHKVCELPLATDVARVLEAILRCRVDGGTLDWNQRVGCPSGRAETSEGNGEKGGNSRLDFLSLAAANGLLSTVWPILREQVPYFTSASAEHPLVIRSKVWAWDWNALPEEERACLERRIPEMHMEEESRSAVEMRCVESCFSAAQTISHPHSHVMTALARYFQRPTRSFAILTDLVRECVCPERIPVLSAILETGGRGGGGGGSRLLSHPDQDFYTRRNTVKGGSAEINDTDHRTGIGKGIGSVGVGTREEASVKEEKAESIAPAAKSPAKRAMMGARHEDPEELCALSSPPSPHQRLGRVLPVQCTTRPLLHCILDRPCVHCIQTCLRIVPKSKEWKFGALDTVGATAGLTIWHRLLLLPDRPLGYAIISALVSYIMEDQSQSLHNTERRQSDRFQRVSGVGVDAYGLEQRCKMPGYEEFDRVDAMNAAGLVGSLTFFTQVTKKLPCFSIKELKPHGPESVYCLDALDWQNARRLRKFKRRTLPSSCQKKKE